MIVGCSYPASCKSLHCARRMVRLSDGDSHQLQCEDLPTSDLEATIKMSDLHSLMSEQEARIMKDVHNLIHERLGQRVRENTYGIGGLNEDVHGLARLKNLMNEEVQGLHDKLQGSAEHMHCASS